MYAALAALALQKTRRPDHIRLAGDEEREPESQDLEEQEDPYSTEYRQIISHSLKHPESQSSFWRIGTAM